MNSLETRAYDLGFSHALSGLPTNESAVRADLLLFYLDGYNDGMLSVNRFKSLVNKRIQ